ncbi:MAG: transposase, partial [Thaumarchaeota archaeon]|nr:transposase [Nitrososphaerota archaeon]
MMDKKLNKQKSKKATTITRGIMTNKTSCGIDLADEVSVATVFSPVGDLVGRFSFPTDEAGFSTVFASKVPKEARIGFEACTMAYPVSRILRALGYDDLTVAHPKELMWIARSKKKNDRVDSEKIARLLMANMLPESHLLSREEQIERDLLIQRVKMGEEIRRAKISLTSYLKREDIYRTLPETYENWSLARRKAVENVKFGDDRDTVLK